jgi:hypothetical protein
MGEADIIGTGRIEPVINPMMAEIALGCGFSIIVKANGMVRAFIDAKLTPGASLIVKDDNPIFPFHYSFSWAGLRTDGFSAVFADVHSPHEIELPVHEFRAIRPDRKVLDTIGCIDWIVFLFAGDFAGLTSPAGELFDNQCMLIHGWPPSVFSGYILQRSVLMFDAPIAGSHPSKALSVRILMLDSSQP